MYSFNMNRMLKLRWIFLLFIVLLIFFGSSTLEATSDIEVYINEQRLETDVAPIIVEGRTLVPMRAIFEALGADVEWDGQARKVTGEKDDIVVILHIDNDVALVNGEPIYLDVPATILDSRTMVPLRFIAESLGADVGWDSNTRTVNISTSISHKKETTPSTQMTVKEIINKIEPKTVLINTHRSQGSGFFVSNDGEVLTNAHVVRGSKNITVKTIYGQSYSAEVKKINNAWDLAVIKVNTSTTFPYIDSFAYTDSVSRGDGVLAFGSPMGLTKTVTSGIISTKRDGSPSEAWTPPIEVIQHDATIAAGSSGGPVVNYYGELIGVSFAGHELKDFNFAIPSNKVIDFLSEPDGYGEKDDWYSFYTEEWEWEKEHQEINKIFNEAMEAYSTSNAIRLIEEGTTRSGDLNKRIMQYEPKFNHLVELREEKTKLLVYQGLYYFMIKENLRNPNSPPYTQDMISHGYNAYINQHDTYSQRYNALFEQY